MSLVPPVSWRYKDKEFGEQNLDFVHHMDGVYERRGSFGKVASQISS